MFTREPPAPNFPNLGRNNRQRARRWRHDRLLRPGPARPGPARLGEGLDGVVLPAEADGSGGGERPPEAHPDERLPAAAAASNGPHAGIRIDSDSTQKPGRRSKSAPGNARLTNASSGKKRFPSKSHCRLPESVTRLSESVTRLLESVTRLSESVTRLSESESDLEGGEHLHGVVDHHQALHLREMRCV